MRRSIIAGALGALVALAACSSTPSPTETTATPATPTATSSPGDTFSPISLPGVVYTQSAGGYRFNHDTSWTVAAANQPTNVVVTGPPGDPKTAPSNVSIQVLGAPPGVELSTYARQDLAFIQAIPGAKVVSARGERLGDEPAYSAQYLLTVNGERIEVLQLTSLSNGQVFSVTYSSTLARFKRDLTGAGLIARSFTFTTPPDQPREGIKAPANGKQVFPIPVRNG